MLTHKKIVHNQNKMESTGDWGKAGMLRRKLCNCNNNIRVSECSSTF